MRPIRVAAVTLAVAALSAGQAWSGPAPPTADARAVRLLNRVSWGASAPDVAEITALGPRLWLDRQLHPPAADRLPAAVQAQIATLPISQEPMAALVRRLDAQIRASNQLADPEQKRAGEQVYQLAMNDLARQATARSLLRDLYSPDQLKEQMTWFWFNQFNLYQTKRDIRAMVGDYEDQAIRPHALGRFRELLEATLRHPAMLRYLDNDQNAVGHINENYAREIMELHTMGVGSGYTQQDVQELARILTGVGVNLSPDPPKLKPEQQALYLRAGLFEFNPGRHDFGDKRFLGHLIKGSGYHEVEQALDLLARDPATARHVSQRLAAYFIGDDPPPALVEQMAQSFSRSDGDIAVTLATLFASRAFEDSLAGAFKDPVHYVVSAVRLVYGDQVIRNTQPLRGWISRLGQTLYNHETPDGYSLSPAAWNGPGQMATRFEVARYIGAGPPELFRPEGAPKSEWALPQARKAFFAKGVEPDLAAPTRAALARAASPEEWTALFLSSPEFMKR